MLLHTCLRVFDYTMIYMILSTNGTERAIIATGANSQRARLMSYLESVPTR